MDNFKDIDQWDISPLIKGPELLHFKQNEWKSLFKLSQIYKNISLKTLSL